MKNSAISRTSISKHKKDNSNLKATSTRQNDEISELQAEQERNEADEIELSEELWIKGEMIKLFKMELMLLLNKKK